MRSKELRRGEGEGIKYGDVFNVSGEESKGEPSGGAGESQRGGPAAV